MIPYRVRPYTQVKICGITNPEDAEAAIAAGADALGFNLFPQSKRFIDVESNRGWMEALRGRIVRVAVLVNEPLERAVALSRDPAIDVLQLHGDEDEAYQRVIADLTPEWLQVIRIKGKSDIASMRPALSNYVLLDALAVGQYGGTGQRIQMDVATEAMNAMSQKRVVVAGGLTPENVADTVAALKPYAVDVAGGVECVDPRRKDKGKMQAFIKSAKARASVESSLSHE